MASKVSIGRQMNKELKVYSNEKLMKIIRNNIYKRSTIYLNVDIKLEEDPFIDDELTHVLHYNYNILTDEIADCGPRETRTMLFSCHEMKYPDTKYFKKTSGYYFFDNPKLMNSYDDTYKTLLLKKFALLSFIYEYRHNLKLSKKSSDIILKQIDNIESHLFFKFFKNVKDINNDVNDDFREFLYDFLGKSIESIKYSSYYTNWFYDDCKERQVEPETEQATEDLLELSEPELEPELEPEIESELIFV